MTDRAEIERLLNQTGRTLEGLPEKYSSEEREKNWYAILGNKAFGDVVIHQPDVIELLVGALRDALDKQPKWISVEERLPEEPGEVLISLYGYVAIAWYHIDGKFETESGMVWDAGLSVTHWMPLPEPPKEVDDDSR